MGAPADIIIRFDRVSKSFGALKVLNEVSFEVPRGTAFCILGRSGTGKSVTLKNLIGLVRPDSGRIFVDGADITGLEGEALGRIRKRMGFLFQYSALFDSITVGENVAFPLRRHTRLAETEILDRARHYLDEVGLPSVFYKMPSDISGGMRKRAGLARALALEPPMLLVDEPSSGLDPITAREIDDLLLELKEIHKTTLVVVTHNIPSARRIGDELALLHQGSIIARGSPDELAQSEHEMAREFMRVEGGT